MYARLISFDLDASRGQEFDQMLAGLKAKLHDAPGIAALYAMRDGSGHATAVVIYESEEAAKAADHGALWASLGGLLTSQPQRRDYDTVHQLAGG